MPWMFGILGLIIGAGAGGLWGAVFLGIAGAWAGHWIQRTRGPARTADARSSALAPGQADEVREQVISLTQRVAQLEAQMAKLLPAGTGIAPQPARPDVPPVPAAPAQVEREIAPEPAPEPAAPGSTAAAPPAGEEPREVELPPPAPLWNWLFGGNALVRIGVVVLFFGVAFLVRYVAEHADVPIEARLAGIAIGAIVMLVIGWRLRDRAGGYGLVLQGGGVGVLYLVVFGAFRIWKLLPPEFAFALLVVVALASAVLAIAQDSRALAIAGVTGGFLAPLLAATGEGNHVALFSFYVVLDLGVLYIAWHKAWRTLNLVGFAFTFGIGTFWGLSSYRPEHFETTEPFLVVFFLLYVGVAVLYAWRRAPRLRDTVDAVLVFGTPLVVSALQLALVREIEYGAAWSAVALGAFYCAAAHGLWRLRRETLQLLVECFVALGVAFGTLAIPYAFDGRWTAASWALEGAAALWVGTRQRRPLAQYFGLLLQPAAGIAFLLGAAPVAPTPVLNSGFVGGVTIAVAGLFCAWHLAAREKESPEFMRPAAAALFAWGLMWWLGTGWEEARLHAPSGSTLSMQLGYATLSSLALLALHRRLNWRTAAFGALGLLAVMVIWATFWADHRAHPFAGYGYLAWPAAFAAFYAILVQVERDLPDPLARASHCVALWLLAALGGWECAWQIDQAVGEGRIWSDIARPLVPALLVAWIGTRTPQSRWPLGPHLPLYRSVALLPIVAALWLWIVFVNVTSSGNPRPLAYVPLLNPLDLAIGLIVIVSLHWWRALQGVTLNRATQDVIAVAPAILGATGFLWLNGMLLRTLHHWAAVPFRWEVMWRSTLVQTAFSVFWTTIALVVMVLANRRRMRLLWVCGAALLGVVVVKLFLLDLSTIGGIERIVSFLGVGVLLLVIGYLAPVPPRGEKEAS